MCTLLLVCKVADALGEETRARQKDQKVRWPAGSCRLVQDLLRVLTRGRFGGAEESTVERSRKEVLRTSHKVLSSELILSLFRHQAPQFNVSRDAPDDPCHDDDLDRLCRVM